MGELWWSLGTVAFGLFLVIHCSLATRKEWKAGIGEGVRGRYDRSEQPAGFWFVMVGNTGAVCLGLIFVVVGLVETMVYFGMLK